LTNPGSGYVGRFAPSPTGDLHLGSLAAAAASYLHARQAGGEWLVRIEDIDPPREVPGSADSILRTLEALDFEWDRDVRRQSSRFPVYLAIGKRLFTQGDAYYCRCSRQEIRSQSGEDRYPGTCRDRHLTGENAALRLRVPEGAFTFADGVRGTISRCIADAEGDFVIVRRDGLPAYHLAVVVDDADQGVSDVVRGADLLDSTPLHICLQQRLHLPEPRYWHIPLVTNAAGEKLSKGTGAEAIDARQPSDSVLRVLRVLGLDPPEELRGSRPRELWNWAIPRWKINQPTGDSRKSGRSD
jgi:glutamyl-Q tRNA(Asp) synthetase